MLRWTTLALIVLAGCDGSPPSDDAGPGAPCEVDLDCDDGRFCNGLERCAPEDSEANGQGCAGGPVAEAPCQTEGLECFELEARCRTLCDVTFDADGDGVASMDCGGSDCADDDPGRFPGNLETCDFVGHDEDCDLSTFGTDRDIDGDGAVDDNCTNVELQDGVRVIVSQGADCDDRRAFRAPGLDEVCNGLDDDCDGQSDEGVTVMRFVDGDGDGDGVEGGVPACPDDTGLADTDSDCDDTTALFRGAPWFELCDGEDNDCDGTVDENPRAVPWYIDADGDGFGDADGPIVISCAPVSGRSLLGSDCDDMAAGVHPGSPELCNGLDDDCNGRLDFFDAVMGFAEDEDGDGVPNLRCHPAGDCDDRDFFTGGDAPEICGDRADNDCDGMVDEMGAVPVDWYPDLDGDGWGDRDAGPAATQCERLARASFRVADCDDTDPLRHPFAVDSCDGVDDDCDVTVDEDAPRRVVFRDVDGDGAGVESESLLICGDTLPAGYADVPRDCAPGDPMVTFRWADNDGDGIGGGEPLLMCTGGVAVGGDCNDGDRLISTGCEELCNGVDDDADGSIDETGAMGCPNAGDTTWACTAGACVFGGCVGTAISCDGLDANGCEAVPETDPAHCGGCGMSCGVGAECAARSCTSTVIDVRVGGIHSCAIRSNGRVACWGALPVDMLPAIQRDEPTRETLLVEGGVVITDASWLEVGPVSWCVGRASDGALRCSSSGNDTYGVAGHGATSGARAMAMVPPAGLTALSSQTWHTCGIGAGGAVLCWGWNGHGQLGVGTTVDDPVPAPVVGISGASAVDVSLRHSCAIAGTTVYCWGIASSGQLGTPSLTPATMPAPVPMLNAAGDPPIDVAASDRATCVLRTSGAVECTGRIGTPFIQTALTSVGTVTGGTQIAGGTDHFCVAAPSGAYCFGSDASGRLGNGPAGATMTPTAATGLTGVVAVDAAGNHTCAVTSLGEVYCWGFNGNGQLGSRTGSSDVPVRVLNLP